MKPYRPLVTAVTIPAFLAIAFCLAGTAFAQWEDPEIVILAGSGGDEESSRWSLILDPDDDPHVVWREFPGGRGAIFYTTEEYSGWSTPIEVGTDGGSHGDPSIEWHQIDYSPVVVFEGSLTGEGDSEIYLARWNGSGFDADRLTENDIPDYNPALSTDIFGRYHVVCIAEIGGEYRLRYLTDASGEPTDQVLSVGNLGEFGSGASPCIDATDLGIAHIAFRGVWSGRYKVHHAFNDEAGGTSWDWEVMHSENAEDFSSSIEVAPSGDVHLAVSGNDCWGCPYRTYYFYQQVYSGWDPYVFIPFGLGLASPSLALDRTETPHLGLVEVSGSIVTGRLYYASEANGWTPTLIIGADHATPSLAVDFDGYGHLVCTTGPNSGIEDVLYVKSSGVVVDVGEPDSASWRPTLVAAPNPFGAEVALTIMGSGQSIGLSPSPLRIFDAVGRLVRELHPAEISATGVWSATWDGRDALGVAVSPGVYFARSGGHESARMVRLP